MSNINLPFGKEEVLKDYNAFNAAWKNGGRFGPGRNDKISIKDAMSTPDAPYFFPKVFEGIVRESIEPLLVATRLLTRINWSYGQVISLPAMGALTARDVAEGQAYPEVDPSYGGSTVVATIGKSGVAFSLTEEMIQYSQFDVISMMLREAGKALARHKERKFFNMFLAQAATAFDNATPTQSLFGVTHGRDLNGTANGSVVVDDIFDAFGHVLMQGYNPDTLMVHPLTWVMFLKDPIMRNFMMVNGGGNFIGPWQGNPGSAAPWSNQGGRGDGRGHLLIPGQTSTGSANPSGAAGTPLLQYPQDINSAPVLPSYMNVPLQVIVSPMIPYDPRTKLTDIYICDSRYAGLIAVGEDPNVGEWTDPSVEITKIKIREKYSLQMLEEGKACVKLRNVKVIPNEVVLPATTQLSVSGSIQPISANTPLSL